MERLLPCKCGAGEPIIYKTGTFMLDLTFNERSNEYTPDPQLAPSLIPEVVIVRCQSCNNQLHKSSSQEGYVHNVVHWWNCQYGLKEREDK